MHRADFDFDEARSHTLSGSMATATTSTRSPRTLASPAEWARDVVGVAQRGGPLAAVYLRGRLDATLRERVMVAVSRVNACGGCTFVHQRWALRAGVSSEELEAIGLGDLAALDERSRALERDASRSDRLAGWSIFPLLRRHTEATEDRTAAVLLLQRGQPLEDCIDVVLR